MYRKKKKGGHAELKGVRLTQTEKSYFAGKAGNLLDRHPAIRVFSITIEKETIKDHVRGDSGRLYNHVSSLVLPDRIKNASLVTVIPDKRSIKAKDSACLADDLQAELWFELKSNTVIENNPHEGLKSLNLRFVDWIGHIIWSRYEDKESEAYDMLKRRIEITPWWETLAGQY